MEEKEILEYMRRRLEELKVEEITDFLEYVLKIKRIQTLINGEWETEGGEEK